MFRFLTINTIFAARLHRQYHQCIHIHSHVFYRFVKKGTNDEMEIKLRKKHNTQLLIVMYAFQQRANSSLTQSIEDPIFGWTIISNDISVMHYTSYTLVRIYHIGWWVCVCVYVQYTCFVIPKNDLSASSRNIKIIICVMGNNWQVCKIISFAFLKLCPLAWFFFRSYEMKREREMYKH